MGELVFEAGQRWEVSMNSGDVCRPILHHKISDVRWIAADDHELTESFMRERGDVCRLLAPAPKPGQHWSKPGAIGVSVVDCGDFLAVEPDNHEDLRAGDWGHGSAVDVAKWLLEHGYSCVEATPAAQSPVVVLRDGMRISESGTLGVLHAECGDWRIGWLTFNGVEVPGALYTTGYVVDQIRRGARKVVESVTPPPAPVWDRAASRRAIDEAVAGLRGQPFAKAIQAVLVAASDDRTLSRDEISVAIAACQAWEQRRGEVAPGRRALTEDQALRCRAAAFLAIGRTMRGQCDAESIIDACASTYERARSL